MSLTFKEVREFLDYNPDTGRFIWRVRHGRWGCIPAGDIAGCAMPNGRWVIGISGRNYYASRLAILWMTGHWPQVDVDHANGDITDDRWNNLREATTQQNLANSRMQKNNAVGFKGVIYEKRRGLYRAAIGFNHRTKFLGYFETPEQAHAAYIQAAKKYFGEFARA